MKAIPAEKIAATVVCTLAIASFGIVPRVGATPVFPPQHVAAEADFTQPGAPATDLRSPSWYRAAPVGTEVGITADNVVASIDVQPWYRNTN